jgi:hypothetical protein
VRGGVVDPLLHLSQWTAIAGTLETTETAKTAKPYWITMTGTVANAFRSGLS